MATIRRNVLPGGSRAVAHERLGVWTTLTAGALAYSGNATQAMAQADHVLKAWEARQGTMPGDDLQAWVAFAAGALAGLGVGSQAVQQADAAMAGWRKLHPEWMEARPTYLPGKIKIAEIALAEPSSRSEPSKPGATIESLAAKATGGESLAVKPVETQSSGDQPSDGLDVASAPVDTQYVEAVDVTATSSIRPDALETQGGGVDAATMPNASSDTAWPTILLFSLPAGDLTEAAVESALAFWPDAKALADTARSTMATNDACLRLARIVDKLGKGKRWDPQRKARSLHSLACAIAKLDGPLDAERLGRMPGVDRRVVEAFEMLVLGQLPDRRPEDPQLASMWDERTGVASAEQR
jgi:hypothetical protein